LRRPLWPIRIPAPVLRAVLGELAELFVDGQRVVPQRLHALKFVFRYATIEAALAEALGSKAGAAARVSGSP
jgi:NAD dependent epimerase/dehydratase family enzyme